MRKLGTAISAFALISCLAGTPAAFADTASHRPGKAGYGDIVPANLRVPAGSVGANPNAQPDAAGNVPHICAGKKLLHHSHVDAAYVTNLQGKLAVTVVDGQHVTEDPNSICVRLAPDADNAAGNEVSRIKVPNNSLYSFLGKPGTAVWNAPQEQIDNWRPVWAGVGAFDTAHEISLPENVLLNRVWLKMISNTGPGDVNVWRTEGFGGIVRGLTSQGDLEPLLLDLGSHGHWNWSFSESGVYRLGFQAGYELVKADPAEKTVTSAPSYVTWLVGSDTEVGLPAGTTTALNTIKTPTAASETIPNPADSPNPAAPPSDTEKIEAPAANPAAPEDNLPNQTISPEEARKQIIKVVRNSKFAPAPILPTNLLLKADFAAEKRETVIDAVSLKALDSNQEEVSKPAIEIPDNFLQDTADGKEWILPASEKEPSLSFDFTGLDPQKRSQPIVYSIDVFSGPDGGRYRAGNTAAGVFKALLDSAKNPISTYTDEAKQIPLTHTFTKPGLYALDFNVETSDKNGNFSYSGKKIYFAVGNETIKQLRLIAAENGKLRADLPDLPDTAQDSPAEPAVTDIETESSADLPGANTAEDSSKKLHLIRSGHIDQALSYDGSTVKVFADDTADPRNPILRPSNTFAYAVPNSAHTLIPADAEGFSEIRAASPQGVWALPETQQQDLPWVGFSTQRVDYSLLDPKKGVSISIANYNGPGRMWIGQFKVFQGGFAANLDSTKPNMLLSFLLPTHSHQAMYFNQAGTYTFDFVYTLHLINGSVIQKPLKVTFFVGDTAITAGKTLNPKEDEIRQIENTLNPPQDEEKQKLNPENSSHFSTIPTVKSEEKTSPANKHGVGAAAKILANFNQTQQQSRGLTPESAASGTESNLGAANLADGSRQQNSLGVESGASHPLPATQIKQLENSTAIPPSAISAIPWWEWLLLGFSIAAFCAAGIELRRTRNAKKTP